jgi:hypothetical protein
MALAFAYCMLTLISRLQAHEDKYLQVLPAIAVSVKVSFYSAGPEQLMETHPIVKVFECTAKASTDVCLMF